MILESGPPFSIFAGSDRSLDGVGGDRADLTGDPELGSDRSKGDKIARYFNTAAFAIPALGTYGSSGRNIISGPGYANVDLSILKNFRTPWFSSEGANLQLRAEAFNVFNRTNLNPPNTTFISSLFGRITTARDPRVIQLGIRFVF